MVLFDLAEEDLKKKWKYLRDQFRCEVRKIPTPKSGDAASQITSSWPYFNSLLFLKDQMKYRNLSGNLKASSVKATQEEVEYEGEIEDILNTSQVEETRDLCDNDEFSCEVPSKKKNISNSTAQLLEIEKRKLALLENKKMEKKTVLDEDEAFFVTLLPHIRKLDPENKFLCRMEMQNVLYKYVYAKVQNMPTLSNETSRFAPLSSPISVSSESYQINSLDLSTTPCFQPISFTTVEGTNIPSTSSSLVPDQNTKETVIYSSY
ncbi:uncharacterized protein LOC125778221 [Bactrocera dorsalis]|uniref:Uncharacterized protein LOC125778221 n=1 Tax=Bactrocera dorsalis TaxID=27457 RepID=A0ABM3JNJ5_BACDO|nr:uncharacterized protein LOC125778221 [Bactrocera dorsalis]